MNPIQQAALSVLEERLGRSIESLDENGDCVFVQVDGVTVTIGTRGAYGIPSVRTYDESLETATNAYSLWNRQKQRDSRDLAKAQERTTGHLNPTVIPDWKCVGEVECPCWNEIDADRRKHRSLRKS